MTPEVLISLYSVIHCYDGTHLRLHIIATNVLFLCQLVRICTLVVTSSGLGIHFGDSVRICQEWSPS